MHTEFRYGRLTYLSFIIIDLVCLAAANAIAFWLYQDSCATPYRMADHTTVVAYMLVIDIITTAVFNTLSRVLRRKNRKEILESVKHVVICFVFLSLLLFSTKQGARFSRVTIYLAYAVYFILIVLCRTGWKKLIRHLGGSQDSVALLVTTAGYASEGLTAAENAGMVIKGIFTINRVNEGIRQNTTTITESRDAAAFLCWEWIKKVFIYGPGDMDVPDSMVSACKQMGIPICTAPASTRRGFAVMKIRTALQKDDKTTGLSFLESERDVPFKISHIYTMFEAEQDKQHGFQECEQSWQLLFCPYGLIDVVVDTGEERKTVSLSDPSSGLVLHPGVWREIYWRKSDSVLCVAASGNYDPGQLKTDYNEYLEFIQARERLAATISAEVI